MHFSAKAKYALAMLFELEEHKEPVSIAYLSEKLCVSARTVEKTHAILRQHGITAGKVGAGGGISLQVPLSELSLGKVLFAFNSDVPTECGDKCDKLHCRTCELWGKISRQIEEVLENIKVLSLKD